MYPNFIFDPTIFNPFDDHRQFPSPESETRAIDNHLIQFPFPPPETETRISDDRLPPLKDVDHTINPCNNQFNPHPFQDSGNHDYTPHTDESNSTSKSQSKSKLGYSVPPSLELLSNYRCNFKFLTDNSTTDEIEPDCGGNLSTVEIIKLAAEKFIKFSTQRVNGYTMFSHPYGSSAFTRLSIDEIREVELVFQLLTAAEKVELKQFEIAGKFIQRCGSVATEEGSPVERLVYYLCEGLEQRIGKETGVVVPTKQRKHDVKNGNLMRMGTNPTFIACHKALPFIQVLQFCGIQAIIDQIGTSSKVHLIDIHIRSGVQWTPMMQALAERKSEIELLKLTAFATSSDVKEVGETGKRLENFAQTLRLPFSFRILVLSDIAAVKAEQFEVQDGEAVAVYSHSILRMMISRPQGLESLMKTIRTINPLIIVVVEVEANLNSTSFVNRFTETLFFYGSIFDCLEACMSRDDPHRGIVEGVHLADGMQNIVSAEGVERTSRSVYINTWRLFFARFGMVEIGYSDSCVYQANLVLQQFACASSCTLELNEKCMIVGWKGTPLNSLSTWKFV